MAKKFTDGKFWTFWRGVSLALLVVNVLLITYILSRFNMLGNLRDAAHNIDSTIVFSLTLLQTIIALGAFGGFWLVRSSAREAAREAAESSVSRFMMSDAFDEIVRRELLSPELQSMIYRGVMERTDALNSTPDNDMEGLSELVIAAGEEE